MKFDPIVLLPNFAKSGRIEKGVFRAAPPGVALALLYIRISEDIV